MTQETQKSETAASIEAVADSYDDATKAQIAELELLAYNNSLPAGDRLQYISQIMGIKERAADAYALEVIGQPESMFPTRQEVAVHIGHTARKAWKVLNTPISQLPKLKTS